MGIMSVRTFRQTHNDQPLALDAMTWRPIIILLLGAIVGLILWTPVLPWLFRSLGLH
jgi:hypothetical protein